MPRRIGRNRGTGSRRTTFLDALVNAVVGEVRSVPDRRAPRREAAQEARLPRDGGGGSRIGSVRLGLRREGEAYEDYSAGLGFGAGSVDDDIDELIRRRGGAVPTEAPAVDIATESGDFAQRLSFELRIGGTHGPSGLPNQRLLEFRRSEGRAFDEDTTTLREQVRRAVREGMGSGWDDDRALRIASDTILAWIIRRVDEQGVDVDLAPLSSAYRAAKAAAGLDTRIGIATGAWRRALARAEVMVTA
jgi:hypothetical protein